MLFKGHGYSDGDSEKIAAYLYDKFRSYYIDHILLEIVEHPDDRVRIALMGKLFFTHYHLDNLYTKKLLALFEANKISVADTINVINEIELLAQEVGYEEDGSVKDEVTDKNEKALKNLYVSKVINKILPKHGLKNQEFMSELREFLENVGKTSCKEKIAGAVIADDVNSMVRFLDLDEECVTFPISESIHFHSIRSRTLLYRAMRHGQFPIIKALLERGAGPLLKVVKSGEENKKSMLEELEEILKKDKMTTPLEARAKKDTLIREWDFIIDMASNEKPIVVPEKALVGIIRRGDFSAFKRITEGNQNPQLPSKYKVDLHHVDPHTGRNILHEAALRGNVEFLATLLYDHRLYAEAAAPDCNGETPATINDKDARVHAFFQDAAASIEHFKVGAPTVLQSGSKYPPPRACKITTNENDSEG